MGDQEITFRSQIARICEEEPEIDRNSAMTNFGFHSHFIVKAAIRAANSFKSASISAISG